MEAVTAEPAALSGMDSDPAAAINGASKQFVTFTLGELEYGVDIMAVREIRGWQPTTRIPNSPEHMRGVTNLRGVIVPNFDLRAKFGMGETEPQPTHVVVLVAVGERIIGILVDAVSDILTVPTSQISPVPEGTQPGRDKWLCGLTSTANRMVSILDLDAMFQGDDLADLTEDAPA